MIRKLSLSALFIATITFMMAAYASVPVAG